MHCTTINPLSIQSHSKSNTLRTLLPSTRCLHKVIPSQILYTQCHQPVLYTKSFQAKYFTHSTAINLLSIQSHSKSNALRTVLPSTCSLYKVIPSQILYAQYCHQPVLYTKSFQVKYFTHSTAINLFSIQSHSKSNTLRTVLPSTCCLYKVIPSQILYAQYCHQPVLYTQSFQVEYFTHSTAINLFSIQSHSKSNTLRTVLSSTCSLYKVIPSQILYAQYCHQPVLYTKSFQVKYFTHSTVINLFSIHSHSKLNTLRTVLPSTCSLYTVIPSQILYAQYCHQPVLYTKSLSVKSNTAQYCHQPVLYTQSFRVKYFTHSTAINLFSIHSHSKSNTLRTVLPSTCSLYTVIPSQILYAQYCHQPVLYTQSFQVNTLRTVLPSTCSLYTVIPS